MDQTTDTQYIENRKNLDWKTKSRLMVSCDKFTRLHTELRDIIDLNVFNERDKSHVDDTAWHLSVMYDVMNRLREDLDNTEHPVVFDQKKLVDPVQTIECVVRPLEGGEEVPPKIMKIDNVETKGIDLYETK